MGQVQRIDGPNKWHMMDEKYIKCSSSDESFCRLIQRIPWVNLAEFQWNVSMGFGYRENTPYSKLI